ncbi:Isopentenyl phosphate kinase [Balamuthia mandrillaris]
MQGGEARTTAPLASLSSHVDALIKVGGAALTHKDRLESLNEDGLAATVELVRRLVVDNQKKVILVHGAGSFGHFQASSYRVSSGLPPNDSNTKERQQELQMGIAQTRRSVTLLAHKVVTALCEGNLPAVCLSPFPLLYQCRKRRLLPSADNEKKAKEELPAGDLLALQKLLRLGMVPVLHGDVVLDEDQEVAILGGDSIMQHLAVSLRPRRVVFLTDVEGVLSAPPHDALSMLIPRILVRQRQVEAANEFAGGEEEEGESFVLESEKDEVRGEDEEEEGEQEGSKQEKTSLTKRMTTQRQHDVTGGIWKKVKCCAEIARAGLDVWIVQLHSTSAFEACSGGQPFVGTHVTCRASSAATQGVQSNHDRS